MRRQHQGSTFRSYKRHKRRCQGSPAIHRYRYRQDKQCMRMRWQGLRMCSAPSVQPKQLTMNWAHRRTPLARSNVPARRIRPKSTGCAGDGASITRRTVNSADKSRRHNGHQGQEKVRAHLERGNRDENTREQMYSGLYLYECPSIPCPCQNVRENL